MEVDPPPGLLKYPPDASSKVFSLADPQTVTAGGLIVAASSPDPPNPEFPEPSEGLLREEVSKEAAEKKAAAAKCLLDYVPRVFRRKALRPLQQIPKEERIESPAQLTSSLDCSKITFVKLEFDPPLGSGDADSALSKKIRHTLHACTNLEVLIVRRAGISQLSWIKAPRLRVLDLAGNQVKSVSQCEAVAQIAQNIESLNLIDNPVSDRTEFFSRIIGSLPDLELLNEQPIAPAMRAGCIAALGSIPGGPGLYRWDLSLCSVPQVKEMARAGAPFRPELLTKLVLSGQELTEFHVGQLTKLEYLDLSKNHLTELRGAGLERCSRLVSLNLSDNLLHYRESLDVLACLPSLLKLWLTGNKLDSNYPHWAIFACRNLKGSNRHVGLVELDGMQVTIDAKMQAQKSCGDATETTPEELGKLRWKLSIITVFGHAQIRNFSYMQSLRVARLAGLGLSYADLSLFSGKLEVLDLSGNNLGPGLDGLEKLTGLKVLNVAENPKIKLKPIMEILSKGAHRHLISVCFAVDKTPEHKRKTIRSSYRNKVFRQLIPCCPRLEMLDGRYISVGERVEALIAAKVSTPEVEKYRFNLAVVLSSKAQLPQTFVAADIEALAASPEVRKAQSLTRFMRSAGLQAEFCNLAPFELLEELDLSSNQIVDPRLMGLQLLKNLHALDLSDNKINLNHKEVADFIDGMPALIAVSLVGNPCMMSGEDRSLVLHCLKSMRQPTARPSLRVLNTEITIDERMAVCTSGNPAADEGLELSIRYAYCLLFRAPTEKRFWQNIQILDFRNCSLSVLDLGGFTSLRVLLLRGNRIHSMNSLQGLVDLRALHTLDVRDNELTDLDQVGSAVSALPNLQTVGLAGNKFTVQPYREKFIRMIQPLWKNLRYPLGNIDGQELSVLEICNAATAVEPKAIVPNKALFRFRIALMRKCPPQSFENISELRLENCGLTAINFYDFGRITRLSLAFNDLKSSAIGEGGIEQLTELRALDLSYNLIKNRKPIKKILSKLEYLEAFWVSPNPGFPPESLAMRRKLVSYRVKCKPQMPPLRLLDGKPVSDLDPRPIVPVYIAKANKASK